MNHFSRRLKKTAPLILLGLLIDHSPVNPSAKALVGGPFDNGQFPGATTDGTYSGIMSGHNLIGFVSFGVSSSQETGGRFSVFHEGFVNYGAATGVADLASQTVAGSLLGVSPVTGSGLPAGTAVAGSGLVGGAVNLTETTGGSVTVANSNTGSITVRTSAEGMFTARMKGYPQRITFEGNGRLSTGANTAVVTTPSVFTNLPGAYTVFFATNGSPEIQTNTNPSNAGETNIAATGGNIDVTANPQHAVLRTETPFKIRGSRTSRSIYQPLYNVTATAPIPLTASTPVPGTPAATPAP